MFRRGYWRMGEAGLLGSAGKDSGVTVLARNSSGHVILCTAATASIPSGTTSDKYAVGCILLNSTTGVLHTNSDGGTTTVPIFAAAGYSFIGQLGVATGACGATA